MKTPRCPMPCGELLIALLFVTTSAVAAGPVTQYDIPRSPYSVSRVFGPYETDFYRVENFGFYFSSVHEPHPEYLYPTAADRNPAGMVIQVFDGARVGDFNGDGWQDMVINWAGSPHTIEKAVQSRPTVFLNDRKGGLYYEPSIWDGLPPARLFTTRLLVADFNGDGRDDFVGTGFGILTRLPNGTLGITPEPIPLVLSQPNGKLADASRNIEGQENGGVAPEWRFAHDLAVGDVNGDRAPDIYQGGFLFLNDGRGNFRNVRTQLPPEIRAPNSLGLASVIGDFNGDGFGDICLGYNDPAASGGLGPGYIVMSRNGRSILENPTVIPLPTGLYGPTNTKNNYIASRDLNGDGRADIVIAQTRQTPYYEGRALQILISRSDGTFADETAARIDNSLRFGTDAKQQHIGENGEGELTFVDVNADGHIDLVDQNAQFPVTMPAITIFLNDGTGRFTVASAYNLPFVPPYALAGFENTQSFSAAKFLPRAAPINLDKQQGIDFVTFVFTPGTGQNLANEMSFYTLRNLKPLTIANVAPVITTQPVSQAVGPFGTAILSVTATGNPAPSYQWKFNGTDLPRQNHSKLFLPNVGPIHNGSYTVVVSNSAGSVTSAPAILSADSPGSAAFINLHPLSQLAAAGADVTFTAASNGTAQQWYVNEVAIPGATTGTLTLRNVQPGDVGAYVLEATRGTTRARSNPARLNITTTSPAPAIVVQPASEMIVPGANHRLVVGAAGALPLTFQWRKSGNVITGATSPVLLFNDATNADAGAYTCTVTNASGSVTTREAALSPYDPGRIINLSILTDITGANPTFTVGTVVGGVGASGAKPLLIRAVGPSLAPLGVPNSLANSRLQVFSGSSVTASNDDWAGAAAIASVGSQVGAFGFTSAASLDAAVAFSPTPGSYTVEVSGVGDATGNVLAEVYDATPAGTFAPNTPVLTNVSVLKQINAGSVLTAGFVIGGSTPKQVLIRAIGPTLGSALFGIPGAMSDTKIELFDAASRVVATNDNWGGDAALAAAFRSVGAFALAVDSRDAALVVRLPPGGYTAQVSGVASAAGLALVEVYEVP